MPSIFRSTVAAAALIAGFAAASAAFAQAPAATAQPAPAAAPPAAAAPAAAQVNLAPAGDIVQTLAANGHFKTLVKALDATNLTPVLKSRPNLTLFAPTDEAFAALGPGEVDKLFANAAGLQKMVIHMMINAPIDSSKFKGAKGPLPSVAGDSILLDGSEDGKLLADNADIIQADVKTANGGIIHVVDKVLVPQPAQAAAPAAAPAATTGQAASATAPAPKS